MKRTGKSKNSKNGAESSVLALILKLVLNPPIFALSPQIPC